MISLVVSGIQYPINTVKDVHTPEKKYVLKTVEKTDMQEVKTNLRW